MTVAERMIVAHLLAGREPGCDSRGARAAVVLAARLGVLAGEGVARRDGGVWRLTPAGVEAAREDMREGE